MSLRFVKPIIILGCPRSGTSLLFTILSESNQLYSLYRESQDIFDSFYRRKAKTYKVFDNDALKEEDLTDDVKDFMLGEFHKYALNFRPVGYLMREYFLKNDLLEGFASIVTNTNLAYKKSFSKEYRIVEKNPRDCFRIPFINKLFPDAKFIYLRRDGKTNISSLIEGWKRPSDYARVPRPAIPLNIKGDEHGKWRYVLPPGWENYIDKTLEEVCAFQWISSNKAAIEGLSDIEETRKYAISYEELTQSTPNIIKKVCDFIDIPYEKGIKRFAEKPPIVSTPKKDKPKEDKWKKNETLLKNVYPMIEPMMNTLGYNLETKKLAEIK
ncbi:MAG: sulfotransferase [Candidatus Melainabacteria bacterium]|nr:sulfotransferase [Candidatus Melainabacteria bacterium]MBI3309225.1 sulfotransferase [Candidatus Melainabacteria bacterium]